MKSGNIYHKISIVEYFGNAEFCISKLSLTTYSMLRYLFILLFHLISLSVISSPVKDVFTLSGQVHSEDGEAVVATIYLKNTSIKTTSDFEGRFSLKASSEKQTIVVTALGYKKYEKVIDTFGGTRNLKIVLRPVQTELGTATVVGKTESRQEREQGFALSTVKTQKATLNNNETSELLNRASGVKLRQSGGVGSEIQYNINGLSGNSIRIFIDGVPMANYGSSFSVSSLPPSMIERIDVYKGVIPAHLADDALGGAINIVLKKSTQKAFTTSYTYGSLNTHKWDMNANYRDSKSGFTVQGSAFFNHSDNNYKVWGDKIKVTDPQTGKVERIKAERFHDAYQSKGVHFNTGFTRVKWADAFLLGFIYSDMRKEIQHGATMEVVYGNRHSKQHTYMGKLQYEKDDLLPGLDLSAHATYASGVRTVVDTIPYMYTWEGKVMTDINGNPILWKKGGGEAGQATLAANHEKTLTGRLRLSYEFLPAQHLSLNFLHNRFTRDVKDPYLTAAEQRFMDTRYLNKSVASVAYDGKFLDDRLQANLFYKYYYQSVKLADPLMQNGVFVERKIARDIDNHGAGGAFSFRLTPKVMLTGSAEYATRLPGITELLGNTTENIESTYELKPEKSVNLNIGALLGTFQMGKHGLEADVNVFFRDIKDMIQKSLTNQTDEMYGYENLGKIRSKGVDLDLRYNFDHRLSSEFKISYTDSRFNLRYDKHGTQYIYYKNRLRNEPYLTFDWETDYTAHDWFLRGSKTSFNYHLGYVHQFYRNWESLGGAGKAVIPTQVTHDIGMVYTFPKPRVSLAFDVKNLFNEQVFDNWALQKPGRMFFVKLTYALNQ